MSQLSPKVAAIMTLTGGVAFSVVVFATSIFRGWKDYQAVQWLAGLLLLASIAEATRAWRSKSKA